MATHLLVGLYANLELAVVNDVEPVPFVPLPDDPVPLLHLHLFHDAEEQLPVGRADVLEEEGGLDGLGDASLGVDGRGRLK